jgi:hypothetical protein
LSFALLGFSAQAETLCKSDDLAFKLDDKQYKQNQTTIGVSPCVFHPWIKHGKFTSLSVVDKPRNGEIYQTSEFWYYYTANTGFKGKDKYQYKICGYLKEKYGCAYITYHVDVN